MPAPRLYNQFMRHRRHEQAMFQFGENAMTWTAPEVCEVCCGMEVTSYMSAEI